MFCGLGGSCLDGKGSGGTSPWVIWPQAFSVGDQLLMQDWPGIVVANLVSRAGARACMLLGFLQQLLW